MIRVGQSGATGIFARTVVSSGLNGGGLREVLDFVSGSGFLELNKLFRMSG